MTQAVSVTVKPVSTEARQLLLLWTPVPLQPQGRASSVTKDSMIHVLSFPVGNEAQPTRRLFSIPCKIYWRFAKANKKPQTLLHIRMKSGHF